MDETTGAYVDPEQNDGLAYYLAYLDGELTAREAVAEIARARKCSNAEADEIFQHWQSL